MPTYADLNVNPPRSWDEFEAITCSAAKNRWNNPNFTRHGRQGQKQDGVDVYGNDNDGKLVGLQCKNTVSGVTEEMIAEEVNKADAFTPALTHLYIATTADTDRKIQSVVRNLSGVREATGKFGVSILFWTDIWQDLTKDERSLFQHYPQLQPREAEQKLTHDERLFREFQSVFPFEPAVRLLREQDFGASFSKAAIRPLMDFVETWDQPEKEFLDSELQQALQSFYKAAEKKRRCQSATWSICQYFQMPSAPSVPAHMAMHVVPSVIEDARILNEEASKFVPVYEQFLRLCRRKLAS
ncbi:hypothetical protein [Burkholderia anthina]|uniref:hypothetical protein n=1 Tax=Burkholderia anthina TaxID=179879 RepID=UPI0037C04A7D